MAKKSFLSGQWRGFLGVFGVLSALSLGATSASAGIHTDVPDAADTIRIGTAEKNDPFDAYMTADLDLEWQSGTITREFGAGGTFSSDCSPTNSRTCLPVDELTYSRSISVINTQIQLGIFHDLTVVFGLPIYLGDSTSFDYAEGVDATTSTVDGVNGTLFDHAFSYRRSGLGHGRVGVRFGVLNDERDDSKPSWVLEFDYITPYTATLHNPAEARASEQNPGGMGDDVHRLRFGTVLSRRIAKFGLVGIDEGVDRRGYTEPYFGMWYTMPLTEIGRSPDDFTHPKFTATPAHKGKVIAGVEIVPYEQLKTGRSVGIDLGLRAEFFSEGRDYTILSEPLDEYNYTEQFFVLTGHLGIAIKAADFVRLKLGLDVGYLTEHFLTNENVGEDNDAPGEPGHGQVTDNGVDEFSPFFDPAVDQVGFRFKRERTSIVKLQAGIDFTF